MQIKYNKIKQINKIKLGYLFIKLKETNLVYNKHPVIV